MQLQELRLARRSKLRFAREFRRYEAEWVAGRWTELQLQQRMEALVAFTLPARSLPWRRQQHHVAPQNLFTGTLGLEPLRCSPSALPRMPASPARAVTTPAGVIVRMVKLYLSATSVNDKPSSEHRWRGLYHKLILPGRHDNRAR
jgi:hypothetical protein